MKNAKKKEREMASAAEFVSKLIEPYKRRIKNLNRCLDSRLRGNDEIRRNGFETDS